MFKYFLHLILLSLILTSCYNEKKNSSVSIVKSNAIYQGMSKEKVVKLLGTPEIIKKNGFEEETWVYQKENTQITYFNPKISERGWLFFSKENPSYKIFIKYNNDQKVDIISYKITNKKVI